MSTTHAGRRQVPVELKPCGWCGEIIERGNKSPAQYKAVAAHKQCASFWAHHKQSEALSRLRESAVCESCHKTMTRRPHEQAQAWKKRRFCDKACAATFSNARQRVDYKQDNRDEKALHVVRYIPGTPEFNRIAQQYLSRGL